MTKKPATNVTASILQRLKNHAVARGETFERILTRYATERFLYRLSVSPFAGSLILKGGNLFIIWQHGQNLRATRDSDFLCRGQADIEHLKFMFSEICGIQFPEDGITFDARTIDLHPIRKQTQYKGTNIRLMGHIGRVPVSMRFDIGVGDCIVPDAEEAQYPPLLPNLPVPVVRTYSCYTVIAEKFEAMVSNGDRNTRVKDFFDVHLLMQIRELDFNTLQEAIQATFQRRKTVLPESLPICFSARYWDDPVIRHGWNSLIADNGLGKSHPLPFAEIVKEIGVFLSPVLSRQAVGVSHWIPGQGWV